VRHVSSPRTGEWRTSRYYSCNESERNKRSTSSTRYVLVASKIRWILGDQPGTATVHGRAKAWDRRNLAAQERQVQTTAVKRDPPSSKTGRTALLAQCEESRRGGMWHAWSCALYP